MAINSLHFVVPLFFVFMVSMALALGLGERIVHESLALHFVSPILVYLGTAALAAGALSVTLRRLAKRRWWRSGPRSWPLPLRCLVGAVAAVTVYLAAVELGELGGLLSRTTDFGILIGATKSAVAGLDPYVDGPSGYFYPPIFALLFAPLTLVPIACASILWFAVKLYLLSLATEQIVDLLPLRSVHPDARSWIILGTIAGAAKFWIADLEYGNTNIVVMALVIGFLSADLRGRSGHAGIMLALATAVKVVPGTLVIWLIARGRWKTLGWFTGVLLIVCFCVPALSPTGAEPLWRSYWEHGVIAKLGEDLSQPDNQSVLGMISRLPGIGLDMIQPLWMASCAVLTLCLLTASWHARQGSRVRGHVVAAMCPVYLLAVSPGSWVVHYIMAMLPLAMVMTFAYTTSVGRPLRWVFWAINVAFTISGWSRPTVSWSIEQSWFVGALVTLFASLYWLSLRCDGVSSTGSSPPEGQ